MSSSALARFCAATILSGVALAALFMVWAVVGYRLNEPGNTIPIVLLAGGLLVAMILSVVGIFTLLWFKPNRRQQDEQVRNRVT